MFDRPNREQEGRATLAAVLWVMRDPALQELVRQTIFDGNEARLRSWAETYGLELANTRHVRRLTVTNAEVLAAQIAGDDSLWTRDSKGSLGYLDGDEFFRQGRYTYRAPMYQPIMPVTQRRRGARRCTLDPGQVRHLTNRDGSPKQPQKGV